MLRSTTHAPDPVTTLTLPADSTQHQLSIMTLATHLILFIPQLKRTKHVGNVLQQAESH